MNPNQEVEDGSVERLPEAKGRPKPSRNSRVLNSKSMLTKNDDSVSQNESFSNKLTLGKRKIKIKTKGPKVKNSHMVILKSIKQKLNIKGMMDSEDQFRPKNM